MDIKRKLLPINEFTRPGLPLDRAYSLIFHWYGNAGTSAGANARYLETLSRQDPHDDEADVYVSAHYFVDDADIIQVIPDLEVAYHSGSRWWNRNSIGIELYHPDWTGKFTAATLQNATRLALYLAGKYEIDPLGKECFQLHHDITGKNCPKWWVDHPGEFQHFKENIARML